jgi:hypothetical protein
MAMVTGQAATKASWLFWGSWTLAINRQEGDGSVFALCPPYERRGTAVEGDAWASLRRRDVTMQRIFMEHRPNAGSIDCAMNLPRADWAANICLSEGPKQSPHCRVSGGVFGG